MRHFCPPRNPPKPSIKKGAKAEARQDYEAAFEFYKAAYQQKPEELKYRVPFERPRMLSAASKIKRGQKLRGQGNLQDALTLFQQAIEVDPSNDLAAQEIRRTEIMLQKGPTGGGQAASTPPSRRDEEGRCANAWKAQALRWHWLSFRLSDYSSGNDGRLQSGV